MDGGYISDIDKVLECSELFSLVAHIVVAHIVFFLKNVLAIGYPLLSSLPISFPLKKKEKEERKKDKEINKSVDMLIILTRSLLIPHE